MSNFILKNKKENNERMNVRRNARKCFLFPSNSATFLIDNHTWSKRKEKHVVNALKWTFLRHRMSSLRNFLLILALREKLNKIQMTNKYDSVRLFIDFTALSAATKDAKQIEKGSFDRVTTWLNDSKWDIFKVMCVKIEINGSFH